MKEKAFFIILEGLSLKQIESAKSRALRALGAIVPCVPYVPTCPCALHALVPSCLACPSVDVGK